MKGEEIVLKELMDEILKGNTKALEELVQIILPKLYRIAYYRLKNEADVNDAIQETLIIFYKNLHKLENKEYFYSWIIKVLKNECNKIYNRKVKNINILERETILTENNLLENPMEDINRELDFDILMEKLNKDEKIILKLYYDDGFEISEISNMLNKNINTIKSKISRAKAKLKNKMKGGNSNE